MESHPHRPQDSPWSVHEYYATKSLGKGSYGQVFEAINGKTGEIVALKKLDKKKIAKSSMENYVLTEIDCLKKCYHPNVIQYKGRIETTNSHYIIMEYCSGGDLEGYLKTRGPLKENEAVELLKQIINGMKELQRMSIVHRDLKPMNILISEGNIKIADFGLAKIGEDEAKTCLGSCLYMAPEVWQNRGKGGSGKAYDEKVDVWSIGIIFYSMLFNKLPVEKMERLNINSFYLSREKNKCLMYPPSINVSQECKDLLSGMLEYSPTARFTLDEIYGLKLFRFCNDDTYRHFIRVMKFIKATSVYIRESTKNTESLCNDLPMYGTLSSILLILKTLNICFKCIESIEKNENIFNLKSFDQFLSSYECCNLKVELTKFKKEYIAILGHYISKFQESWPGTLETLLGQNSLTTIIDTHAKAAQHLKHTTRLIYRSLRAGTSIRHTHTDLYRHVAMLHVCAVSDDAMAYTVGGKVFDWSTLNNDTSDMGFYERYFELGMKDSKENYEVINVDGDAFYVI